MSVVADSGDILKMHQSSQHTTLSRDGKLQLSNDYWTQVRCYWKGAAQFDVICALPSHTGESESQHGGFWWCAHNENCRLGWG
jgi:hypothetical protein